MHRDSLPEAKRDFLNPLPCAIYSGHTTFRSSHTVQKALNREGVKGEIEGIKKDLISKLEGLANELVDSIRPADINRASLLQRVTACGIAIDKGRLLSNQSTANESIVICLQVPDTKEQYLEMQKERAKRIAGGIQGTDDER